MGLRGADLSGARLRGAQLDSTDGKEAVSLEDADLSGADLRGADLRGADLRGTDLRSANLRHADLSRVDLGESKETEKPTDLSAADLSKTIGLTQEKLERSIGNRQTRLPDDLQRPRAWHKPIDEQEKELKQGQPNRRCYEADRSMHDRP